MYTFKKYASVLLTHAVELWIVYIEKECQYEKEFIKKNDCGHVVSTAAETLKQNGFQQYYFEPNNFSEIDFVTYYKGQVVPIEVKSGLHTRSTSFSSFIKKYQSPISFRFSKKNLGHDEESNTWYVPHYVMQMLFEEEIF